MASPRLSFKSKLKNLKPYSKSILANKQTRPVLFIAAFAIVGIIALLATRAATPFASIELGTGSNVAAPATIVSGDNSASSSSYVQFGSGTVTPPPSGTSRCPAYPAFPDANCTGVLPGIARTNHSGSLFTSSDNQVIQNLNINGGQIRIRHKNVVIKNVKITNPGGVAVSNIDCSATCSFTLEDSELDGTGNTGAQSAVDYSNYTLRRNNIHHFGEGPGGGSNTIIEDNYLHDFLNFVSTGAHQDGIQIEFGANNVVRHNTIIADVDGMSSCIQVGNQEGNTNNLVENNLMGGGSICLRLGGVATGRNNHITTVIQPNGGYYGPSTYYGSSVSSCGNRWHDGPNAGQFLTGDSACAGG
jgi:hypothetical protein